jgi:hypothetical protein
MRSLPPITMTRTVYPKGRAPVYPKGRVLVSIGFADTAIGRLHFEPNDLPFPTPRQRPNPQTIEIPLTNTEGPARIGFTLTYDPAFEVVTWVFPSFPYFRLDWMPCGRLKRVLDEWDGRIAMWIDCGILHERVWGSTPPHISGPLHIPEAHNRPLRLWDDRGHAGPPSAPKKSL